MSSEKAIYIYKSANIAGVAIDGFHSLHYEYRWAARH